jgi:hypothetical protein
MSTAGGEYCPWSGATECVVTVWPDFSSQATASVPAVGCFATLPITGRRVQSWRPDWSIDLCPDATNVVAVAVSPGPRGP